MEFWGVEVKAGKPVMCEMLQNDRYIHLSTVALGEAEGKGKGKSNSSTIFVNIDGKKLVLGTLTPDKCPHISLDLIFHTQFELSHSWKDGSVFFTGYTALPEPDLSEDDSSDSELEDLKAEILENEKNKAACAAAGKPDKKAKTEKPVKPAAEESEDSDDDSDESENEGPDEEMGSDEDDSDDEDEDESSEEETPKKVEVGKKRQGGSVAKTLVPEKKVKVETPAGKTGSQDGKKIGKPATPHPSKQAPKTPASSGNSKPQTPKSAGAFACKSCSKTFNSDGALQSHTKAKHSS